PGSSRKPSRIKSTMLMRDSFCARIRRGLRHRSHGVSAEWPGESRPQARERAGRLGEAVADDLAGVPLGEGEKKRLTSGDLRLEYGVAQGLCLDETLNTKRRV